MDSEYIYRLQNELFKHASESVVVVDETGFILLINPATERLFGYSKSELIGKKVEHLLPENKRQQHQQNREKYHENPHTRKMGIGLDLLARKKNGDEFPVEISLSPFKNQEKKFVIAFIIDITLRKKSEQEILIHQQRLERLAKELKAANEKLETKVLDRTKILQEALTEIEKSRAELETALEKERELNELKSRFLSMASHEFRTPLTTILSSASLIPEYGETNQQEKRVRHVQRIQAAVSNLNDILSDFLSLSKIEEGKIVVDYRPFNLQQLGLELCNDLTGMLKTGQHIIPAHNGNELVNLDPKLIRNIILNLLSNAVKFSDEHKEIFFNTTVTDNTICLVVKDAGIGISKEDQEHLFERFFRGHNATNIQGTGLGLNIVSRYVELMNGYIEVKSELGKGTTFTVSFKNIHEKKVK
jgi:PAS domain S-box-containing protein